MRVWESLASLLLHTDVERLSGNTRETAAELDVDDAQDAARMAEEGAEFATDAGFDAEPLAVRGKPKAWPAVLGEADRVDAALIVAGSRGQGSVRSALLGSVSSGLLHHKRRPLLVVPPGENDESPGPIIVGYDGSAGSREAVSTAGRLLSVQEAIVETVWIPRTPVAGAGAAGAPVPVVPPAAEQIDLSGPRHQPADIAFRIFTLSPIAIVFGTIEGYSRQAVDGAETSTVVIGGSGLLFLPPLLMLLFRQKYPGWWFDWKRELLRFETGWASTWR
jgi:nucleotide-binding universal stress UspA family protein